MTKVLSLLSLVIPVGLLAAQQQLPEYAKAGYRREDYRIPMRDGKRLFTTVYSPTDTTRSYPILLTRTPYATDGHLEQLGPGEVFARAGYIFAYQDVRGKYQSEGDFVDVRPYRPHRRDSTEIDETTDTYDAVDWLVKNIRGNNGSVGQYGISYLGFYSTMGVIDAHPAVKAVSPQAPVTDWFKGDDWHHNGAFFLFDGFSFLYSFGVPRPVPTTRREPEFEYPTPDGYQFYLDLGPLKNVDARYFKGRVAFWKDLMAHGTYDAFWKARDPLQYLDRVRPAVMTVGGWFDAEDLWGTLSVYQTIERKNPGKDNILVMGPWFHGGWYLSDGSRLGDVGFGGKTSDYYHERIELPFFEHYLRGGPKPALPEASVFETGVNQWRGFDSWPPKESTLRTVFLGANGRLAFDAAQSRSFDEFVSDPARPVPYLDGQWTGRGSDYMIADQRFAERRPDVLVYRTEPLTSDLRIAGPVAAALSVSTTGTDADWVVKLIDEYPLGAGDSLAGYQQLVRAEIMRGKFRNGLERPVPFVPGQPTKVEFTLPDALHTFRKGHRLMVQIQSSWFPLVDRNPQRFVDIYSASANDFRKATHRVYRGGAQGSRLVLRVLP